MADTPTQTTQPAQPTPPSKSGGGLEGWLETYLVKIAPFQIPPNGREWIVKAAPWIVLVLLILLLPAILAVFSLGTLVGVFSPAVGVAVGPLYYLALIVLLIQAVVMAVALPGLFKRKRSAWKLLFWATIVSITYGLVGWVGTPTDVGGLLWAAISAVISLYILFQVRDHYRA
jgi:hypothetical protein